jgi:hypothetical protein
VVKLSPEVRSESALAQRRMLMQLEASLDALGNISSFTVTAGELDLDPAPEVDFDFTYQVRDGVIGGLDGRFGTLTADGVAQLSTIQTAADDLQPTGASLGRDRAQVAILGPAGVTLVGESGTPTPIDSRAGLLPPSLDPHGVVWTIPRGPAAGPSGSVTFCCSPEPESISSVCTSPDVGMLTQPASSSAVAKAGITSIHGRLMSRAPRAGVRAGSR